MTRPIPVFFALLLVAGMAGEARAYLDPGTGNYILQLLLAAGIAAAFFIKTLFTRAKSYLQGLLSKK